MTKSDPRHQILPVLAILMGLLVLWYAGAAEMNATAVRDRYDRAENTQWTLSDLLTDSMAMDRPVVPAPHQVLAELDKSVFEIAPSSKRSLVYHAWVTLTSALTGFAAGVLGGIALAVLVIHLPVLERAIMPWIVASQTVPILAIAPMVVGVLGAMGLSGLLPKAVISAYLCFLPVTIGMVQGLRSADAMQMDLIRTYSATRNQTLWKLRLPASLPNLFASLKISIALAISGAIVAELPTGAQEGLGARLLSGSYYGQTTQIWATLVVAAIVTATCVGLVSLAAAAARKQRGGRW